MFSFQQFHFCRQHLLELWQSVKPEDEIPPSFPTTQIWLYSKTVSNLCAYIRDQYFSPISCFFFSLQNSSVKTLTFSTPSMASMYIKENLYLAL